MVVLELSADEAAQLRSILESHLSDLRMEIADTDRMDYRELLHREQKLMEKLLMRLGSAGLEERV